MTDLHQQVSRLLAYDTPTLCNAMEKVGTRPRNVGFTDMSIRHLVGAGRVAGTAVTARMAAQHPGDEGVAMSELFELISASDGPPIVVLEDTDEAVGTGSLLGEVTGNLFTALGVIGFATNGAVRDMTELRELGLAVFAQSPCVSHAYVRLTEIGTPVRIGGMAVATGDVLHGDEHGLLNLPRECLDQLPVHADAIRERELRTIAWARSPEFASHGASRRRGSPEH